MSTINPPVELEDPDKQFRLEYIQNIATQADFDYPQVAALPCVQFTLHCN